jgi:hypothetical protein
MDLEWRFGKQGGKGQRRAQGGGDGRRLLVLADFGARESRGLCELGDALAGRPLVRVKQEDLDAAVAAIAPRLALPGAPGGAAPAELAFAGIEDFHPDQLFARVPALRAPAPAAAGGPASAGAAAATTPSSESDNDALSRLLGKQPGTRAPSTGTAIDALLGRIVAEHGGTAPAPAPTGDPRAQAAAMRGLLRQRPFQALEAAWRGLQTLVSRLDEEVEVFLLDVSRPELDADLGAETPIDVTALGRRILSPPGGRAFTALIGAFTFGPSAGDVARLGRLAALASRAGAPFVAAAAPALLGCESIAGEADPARWPGLDADGARRWEMLRRSADAPWIGLCMPRFLARAPYGAKAGGAIDAFPFDEIDGAPAHDAFLWSNPAFLCGLLLAREAARNDDDDDGADSGNEIDDLPFFSYRHEGEVEMQPSAEVFWSERAATAVMMRGLMPVMSQRDRNAVRVVRLQSIADPPSALGG